MSYLPLKLDRRTFIAGDTLFIDGSPHKFCGHCGCILDSGDQVRESRSKRGETVREIKDLKITILAGWIELEPELHYENDVPVLYNKFKPIVRQKVSCFGCWNNQQRAKLNFPDRLAAWAYAIADCMLPELPSGVEVL